MRNTGPFKISHHPLKSPKVTIQTLSTLSTTLLPKGSKIVGFSQVLKLIEHCGYAELPLILPDYLPPLKSSIHS